MTSTDGVAFSGPRAFLSNFAPSPLRWNNRDWPDVETAFAAAKTLDDDQRDWVAAAASPGDAKRRGRHVTLRPGWDDGIRDQVMAELLAAKFAPGSDLADALLATGDDELVEANTWGDRYWGRVDGTGVNMLGRLLMARRAILRAADGCTVDARADLWDLWLSGAWATIPTNRQTRRDGTAVMGAGVARAAAERIDGLEARYGSSLRAGHARIAFDDHRILCVPTKGHWRNPSTVELVADAANGLAAWCAAHPNATIAVPALGAGLGGLDWDLISDILGEHLTGARAVLLPPR